MSLIKFNRHFKNIFVSCYNQTRFQRTLTQPKQSTTQSNEWAPVFRKAVNFSDNLALRDSFGSYTYGNLLVSANELSKEINKICKDKNDQVLYLCPNDANNVITQWAIWISGKTAVPVHPKYPQKLLEYYAQDSNSKLLITTPAYAEIIHKISKSCNSSVLILDEHLQETCLTNVFKSQNLLDGARTNDYYLKKNAMILYTSGTTGNPKGVVLTHKNLLSQITCLVDAWKWTSNDTILHTLPLHHTHGIINALLCPLYVGAKVNMLPKFDPGEVWSQLLGINCKDGDRKITVFMAVPTIYTKLIEEYERIFSQDLKMSEYIRTTLKNKMRLMVSGSASLPIVVHEKWLKITGQKILERYGMSEIGMCLSHEYDSEREAGYVGVPLPGITIRLGQPPNENEGDYTTLLECSNNNSNIHLKLNKSLTFKEDPTGELLVKGESVFKEYFNRNTATDTAFTVGKWFKTGDMCQFSLEKKMFKILGRNSVDIIKTGGFKISALDIEKVLLEHEHISDCAVIGLKDSTWGEVVTAIIVLKQGVSDLTVDEVKLWSKNKLPHHSIPKVIKVVDSIPKNAMGKVNKVELEKQLFPPSE